MRHYKIFFLIIISFFMIISCDKKEHFKMKKPSVKMESGLTIKPDIKAKEIGVKANEKSKQKELVSEGIQKTAANPKPINKSKEEKLKIAANQKQQTKVFFYLQKIIDGSKIGETMTDKELSKNPDIPEDGLKLVKSITKISSNEIDIKWKSTWMIEKLSDAEFKDSRLKIKFDKNKMYTSGDAIAINYNNKMYTNLIIIGRSAYIPNVKGLYWQIGK